MVRHGLMTVGMPPCAKTMVKDVLAETLSLVADGLYPKLNPIFPILKSGFNVKNNRGFQLNSVNCA